MKPRVGRPDPRERAKRVTEPGHLDAKARAVRLVGEDRAEGAGDQRLACHVAGVRVA